MQPHFGQTYFRELGLILPSVMPSAPFPGSPPSVFMPSPSAPSTGTVGGFGALCRSLVSINMPFQAFSSTKSGFSRNTHDIAYLAKCGIICI